MHRARLNSFMPRTVIVTGASRGIGLAAVTFLLADKANVVALQRTSTPELTALAEKYPSALRVVQGDFTSKPDVAKAIAVAVDTFGAIDSVLFNAATNSPFGRLNELTKADWQKVFTTNFFGVVEFLQDVLPHLRKSTNSPSVVFVGSAAADFALPGGGPYSASKAALHSLNRTLSAEEPGIVSVCLDPGAARTEMFHATVTEGKAYLPPQVLEMFDKIATEPDVQGKAAAALVLRAPKSLSGKYVRYDNPDVTSL